MDRCKLLTNLGIPLKFTKRISIIRLPPTTIMLWIGGQMYFISSKHKEYLYLSNIFTEQATYLENYG